MPAVVNPSGVMADRKYAFGPGRIWADTKTGGANVDLGPTDGITFEMGLKWLGLKSVDTGDKDDESVATMSDWILTCGLAKMGYEVLGLVMPSIELERDTAGNLIAVRGVEARGHSTEDHRIQFTFKEYDRITNSITTDPWRIIDFYSMAAMPDKVDLKFDLTQRFFPIRLHARNSEAVLSPRGRPTAWKIRGGLVSTT